MPFFSCPSCNKRLNFYDLPTFVAKFCRENLRTFSADFFGLKSEVRRHFYFLDVWDFMAVFLISGLGVCTKSFFKHCKFVARTSQCWIVDTGRILRKEIWQWTSGVLRGGSESRAMSMSWCCAGGGGELALDLSAAPPVSTVYAAACADSLFWALDNGYSTW